MSGIRLTVSISKWQVVDAKKRLVEILLPQLRCLLLIGTGRKRISHDAVQDTGARISIVPQKVWERFEDQVEWLSLASGRAFPPMRFAGGEYDYRMGQIPAVATQGDMKKQLPRVLMTALYPKDAGKLKHVVLGLWGGILQGRRLRIEPDLSDAWIEES